MQTQLLGRTSPSRLSPRWTCLPTRWLCIEVALSDPPQTSLQCWLASVDLPSISSTFNWSCTWWTNVNSNAMLTRREDKSPNSMDLIGICGKSPHATPLKSTSVILKSNSASASLDFKITSVDLSPSRWSPTPNNIGLQLKSQIWDWKKWKWKKERWDWLHA